MLILQPDKGNVTTTIKREDYLHHCLSGLSDVKYYKIIARDPTMVIQNQSNTFVTNLNNKGYITPEKAKSLICYGNTFSKFDKILPKIHTSELELYPLS